MTQLTYKDLLTRPFAVVFTALRQNEMLLTLPLCLAISYMVPALYHAICFMQLAIITFKAHTLALPFTIPLLLATGLGMWLSKDVRPLVTFVALQLPTAIVSLLLAPLPSTDAGPTVTMVLTDKAPFIASPLAILPTWNAHHYWTTLAKANKRSTDDMARIVKEDTEFHWNLDFVDKKDKQEAPLLGQLVRSWNRVVMWDEACIPLDVLESWRTLADPVADAAVAVLFELPPGGDALTRLAKAQDSPSLSKEVKDAVSKFWDATDRLPPRGAGAVSETWYRQRDARKYALPQPIEKWHDVKEQVEKLDQSGLGRKVDYDDEEWEEHQRVLCEGQAVFYRYGPPILLSLLHMGLAGGFASPRVSNVLKGTGYLLPKTGQANDEWKREKASALDGERPDGAGPTATATSGIEGVSQASADRTFRRLLETTSWLLDVMESLDGLAPPSCASRVARKSDASVGALPKMLAKGGTGWASTLRVRLLHASVRKRLGPQSAYNSEKDGVAINQEDLLATLCAFAVVPLWSLQSMGITPSERERELYISTWRYIGFYNGISPVLLRQCFASAATAERFFSSTASHHFIMQPKLPRAPPALTRGELPKGPLEGPALPLLHSVSRRPPGGMSFAAHLALARFLIGPDLSTALHVPATSKLGFVRLRIALVALALPPLFARYYPRTAWGSGLRENCRALLRRVILWSLNNNKNKTNSEGLSGLEDEVHLEPEEGQRIVRQYRGLMTEMGIVLAVVGVLILFTLARVAFLMWNVRDMEAGVTLAVAAASFAFVVTRNEAA